MEVRKLPGADVATLVEMLEKYYAAKGDPPSGIHLVFMSAWKKLEGAVRKFNANNGALADRANVDELTFRGVPIRPYQE